MFSAGNRAKKSNTATATRLPLSFNTRVFDFLMLNQPMKKEAMQTAILRKVCIFHHPYGAGQNTAPAIEPSPNSAQKANASGLMLQLLYTVVLSCPFV